MTRSFTPSHLTMVLALLLSSTAFAAQVQVTFQVNSTTREVVDPQNNLFVNDPDYSPQEFTFSVILDSNNFSNTVYPTPPGPLDGKSVVSQSITPPVTVFQNEIDNQVLTNNTIPSSSSTSVFNVSPFNGSSTTSLQVGDRGETVIDGITYRYDYSLDLVSYVSPYRLTTDDPVNFNQYIQFLKDLSTNGTSFSFLQSASQREFIYNPFGGDTLATSGVSYSGSATILSVTTVPVPAGAWLFGSALIGLAGIKRKK